MAAFIVISTDNKLHDLVDDIEKCRPRNPRVETYISTGKIISSESGEYTYSYTVAGEVEKNEEKVSLSNLLSNQFARFRKVCGIPKAESVNVFLLENPLNEKELEQEERWLSEFEDIYEEGQGKDTGFRLFRILFTYDVKNPTDICAQISANLLKGILTNHRTSIEGVNQGVKKTFSQFIFYIDNQNSDAAALCLSEEDYNLKLPRYLIDVMMLISNPQDSYGVMNAITNTDCPTRCFSVGYAESMYYYPDVESYFDCADQKELLHECLNGEDEVANKGDKKVMDVSKYPFGLQKRKNRLSEIYTDIPFSEDIKNYPQSADKIIDDKLVLLKEYIESKRQEEIDEFECSDEIVEKKKELELYEEQREALKVDKTLTEEELSKKSGELSEKISQIKRILKEKREAFLQKCHDYIDRKRIYQKLCVSSDSSKNDLEKKYSDDYKKLLDYVCSVEFLEYVNKEDLDSVEEQNKQEENVSVPSDDVISQNRKGCLGWLFFWKKDEESVSEASVEDKNEKQEDYSMGQIDASEVIVEIKEKLDLKRCYVRFVHDVANVKEAYLWKKKECDEFKLTTHSNSYYPLIDLEKLKELQWETYKERFGECLQEWDDTEEKDMETLKTKMKEKSIAYANKYTFINWTEPFSFVKPLSVTAVLPKVCNKLQAKAAPFVNYNLTTAVKENKVVLALYSDMPTIIDDFKQMKGSLNNGTEISVYRSSHIESKICMMQFLPMDDEVLNNLVDLLDSSASNVEDLSETLQVASDDNKEPVPSEDATCESTKNDTEFWGDH